VIASCYDLNQRSCLDNITLDQWNNHNDVEVFYLTTAQQTFFFIKKLISERTPDVIYLNGMYSLPFVIFPIIIWKWSLNKNIKLILAPRGMLQEGALKLKPLKKKLFLTIFKSFGLHKDIEWHATDDQEYFDIQNIFGHDTDILAAPNIPKRPVGITPIQKNPGQLRLVFLSVISEKKNLHLAIKWLNNLGLPITFDIYGPIKDEKYWKQCQQMFNANAVVNISYKGDIHPDKVQAVFSKYHALLLPTGGENFGHAIYECLSVGRPVIISDKTPWNNINKCRAGFSYPLQQENNFKGAIRELYSMDKVEFEMLCANAYSIANKYWDEDAFEKAYARLF
jgi:glycosyltransferase involved in cell wall biosynthesis